MNLIFSKTTCMCFFTLLPNLSLPLLLWRELTALPLIIQTFLRCIVLFSLIGKDWQEIERSW